MKFFRIASFALAWLASATLAHAALPPGISGSWYNPDQPGHGLTVEILDEARALVGWYVYDPIGNPVNLYVEGVIEGTTIRGQAYVGRGMRFGSFDPRDNRVQPWGTVTLAFSSCDASTLSWNADGIAGLGYVRGSMSLRRLTRIATVGCQFSVGTPVLPVGTYTGTWRSPSGGAHPLYAAVDSTGRLWAAQSLTAGHSYFSLGWPLPVFFGSGARQVNDGVELSFDVLYGSSLAGPQWELEGVMSHPVTFSFGPTGTVSASSSVTLLPGVQRFEFAHDPAASDPLRQVGFDPASLQGSTFRIDGQEQFFSPRPYPVRFEGSGRICIEFFGQRCGLRGSIGAVDPALAMFDVEFAEQAGNHQVFTGKAWLTGSPRKLVIVARDARVGFSAVASEQ